MSNEKADEFLAWRARLSQPDALPEQGLDDPETAWQQLAARLQKKSGRRFIYWYGIAAACLLLALIPAALLFRERPSAHKRPGSAVRQAAAPRTVKTTPAPAGIAVSSSEIPSRVLSSGNGSFRPVAAAPARSVAIPSKPRSSERDAPNPSPGTAPLGSIASGTPSSVEMPSASIPPTLVSVSPASDPGVVPTQQRAPVKKALRVVSINEIDPVDNTPVLTFQQPPVPPKTRLHTRGGGGLVRQASADREEDPAFLKIKLSLQNP